MTNARRSPVLGIGIVIGLALGVAELVSGGAPWAAAVAAAFPIAYALVVTVIAPRSDTASVLAGRPIDERAEHTNLEASSWAFGVSAVVVLAAFVVAQVSHGDWAPYAFVAAVMGVAFIGSLLILRVR